MKGKVVIITGASSGIGKALSEQFAMLGAYVVLAARDLAKIQAISDELNNKNCNTLAVKTDVSNEIDCQNLIKTSIEKYQKIDILINNAGITRDKLLLRMTEEDWDLVLSVNLKGAFNTTKAVIRTMASQRYGKIVNVSSVVGLMGNAGQANYSASKAGLLGLTKSTAKEFASRNINVNAVAPGFVETEMTAVLTEEQRKLFLDVIPMKRGCKPEEIAEVIAFLSSDMSGYMTGQVLAIDGGMTM